MSSYSKLNAKLVAKIMKISEDRFSVLFSEGVKKGRVSLNEFVNIILTQAAKLFGLFPRKGTIAPGSDADIVLLDPNAERTKFL